MCSRVYVTVKRPSVRPSVCPIVRQPPRRAAGLLLRAPRADISIDSGGRWRPAADGAAARRSAVNVGSVTLTAELTRLNPGLLFERLKNIKKLLTMPMAESVFQEIKLTFIGNESVPIQLAQCWFPGLAISNAKKYKHFFN